MHSGVLFCTAETKKILVVQTLYFYGKRKNIYAYLRDASLRYSSLRDAYLRYASLRHASLHDACLRYASLRYASLRDAYLRDASALCLFAFCLFV